jgi:hypothetical protein
MPINKLTTLLDLSRQSKIISGETATFDGKIQMGIPFSGYPSGVDISTSVSLGVVSSETAVFSGNTGTTVFDVSNPLSTNYDAIFSGLTGTTWSNPLFSAYTSGLTLPITPLSAGTQIVGPFWSLTQTGKTGDYIIGIQYTGFSITYSFNEVSLFGTGFTYSGLTTATQQNFSAGTLDYKGPLDYISSVEDATINGRLTTNRITITNGASSSTNGYVLTSDSFGNGSWQVPSGGGVFTGGTVTGETIFTGGLSATTISATTIGSPTDCVDDLYVTNIHSCAPLNINPLDEGNVYFGSTSGITIDVINNRLGINNPIPQYILDISGTTGEKLEFQSSITVPRLLLSVNQSNRLNRFMVSDNTNNGGVEMGFRGATEPTFSNYGKQGDSFIRAGNNSNGLNIIEAPTSPFENYIRFFAGNNANTTPDIHIQGSGSTRGFVGINNITPTERLDVVGKTKTTNFQMTNAPTNGYVLTSDAFGNASWQPSSGGVPSSTTATTTTINFTGQTIYYDAVTPGTGNISEDLSNAKLGLIQKIYHNDVAEPTYPAGWVLMGDAIYFTSTLNIIYSEWAGGSRVEYWYVQEQ